MHECPHVKMSCFYLISPREKWQHVAKIFFPPRVAFSQFNSTQFARGVIFTRARVSLALLSLGKNGGLPARSVSRRSLGSTLSLRTLRDIVRSLSAKYRPDRYRRDKSVKFGTELPWHLPINTGGGARYKWS